jgi:SAM-dependent methyltransferase
MILKDSSPYNIQFEGGRAVFIDIPSLEDYEAGSAWVGYRQFCQLFLYPLMLQAYKNLAFQPLLKGAIDGITPEAAEAMFSFRDRFRGGVFTHAYLQAKLQVRYSGQQKSVSKDLKSAGFNQELIKANIRRLLRLVGKLNWQPAGSEWAEYAKFHNYNDADHQRKEAFVATAAAACNPGVTWDVGCNTGQFSKIAAAASGTVIALDADQLAVEYLYQHLKSTPEMNIQPLVMNLSDPSPNWGWRGTERTELALRASPDLVLCLAVLHHAVISANIPVAQFVDWLAGLDSAVVIEFVGRDDDKVKQLLRNKADQYEDYHPEYFERCLLRHFVIEERLSLNEGRRELFFCRQRHELQ